MEAASAGPEIRLGAAEVFGKIARQAIRPGHLRRRKLLSSDVT